MEFIKYFIEKRPDLVAKMKSTHHDYSDEHRSPYHREGDVWTHSLMVSQFTKSTLGLCHDIGKCFTRSEDHEKQKVSFQGHAGVSTYMSVDLLRDYYKDKGVEKIEAQLFAISHHIRLYDFLKESNGEKKFLEYYKDVNYDYITNLFSLGEADNQGRISLDNSDKKGLDEIRHYLLKDRCSDTDRLSGPTLSILVGPPACGKSTFIKDNYSDNTIIISRDNLVEQLDGNSYADNFLQSIIPDISKKIDDELQKQYKDAIHSKKDIIIDMTNMSPKSRRKWLHTTPNSYYKECINFMKDYSTINTQNKKRAEETGKFISENTMIQMMKNYAWLVYSEGFDSIQTIY